MSRYRHRPRSVKCWIALWFPKWDRRKTYRRALSNEETLPRRRPWSCWLAAAVSRINATAASGCIVLKALGRRGVTEALFRTGQGVWFRSSNPTTGVCSLNILFHPVCSSSPQTVQSATNDFPLHRVAGCRSRAHRLPAWFVGHCE